MVGKKREVSHHYRAELRAGLSLEQFGLDHAGRYRAMYECYECALLEQDLSTVLLPSIHISPNIILPSPRALATKIKSHYNYGVEHYTTLYTQHVIQHNTVVNLTIWLLIASMRNEKLLENIFEMRRN